jgi:uncharacterized protein
MPAISGDIILKVIVGSRAHGLAREDSDYDYRAVFVHPTSRLLSLGAKPNDTAWIEGTPQTEGGKIDDTAWEIGHFLNLATRSNPTILETFVAPVESIVRPTGESLRNLFNAVWEPRAVRDSFIGYGHNQRKKMLDNKDARANKYACAYLRVLYQGSVLLQEGWLPIDMTKTPIYDTLVKWRAGNFTNGEAIDVCAEYEARIQEAWVTCPQTQNFAAINDFLLATRRHNW